MRYIPELDGLRALAVIAVLLFHANPFGPVSGGFVGVDLFFVLSAFLITSLLADELAASGRVDLVRFYWRRFLRLAPALTLMLAVYLAVAPLVWPGYPHARDAALAAVYVADYSYALARAPLYLQHTWSLAVEEHFYLLWPLLLPVVIRTRHRLLLLGAAWVALTMWRCDWAWPQSYYRFDTHATGLVLGAALVFARPRVWPGGGTVALGALAVIAATADIRHSWLAISAAEVCGAVLVVAPPAWLARFAWLGRRSYGVYLWHFPIAYVVREHFAFAPTVAIVGAASIALASLSYATVERWGRRLRDLMKVSVREPHTKVVIERGATARRSA